MTDAAQTILVIVAVVLAGFLAVRLVAPVSTWIQRTRRPETRAIRVIGVGGGGSNAVDRMVAARIPGVTFVACNTDAQVLRRSKASTKLRIGESITRGLGSGGDPDVGRRSAEENEARIARTVANIDLVFIIAGLGGGTGSGAAPIIGADARTQGALTIAVVTMPFAFEGVQRRRVAESAVAELAASVDAVITISNDQVAQVVADDASMLDAFRVVDDVLLQAVRGIVDVLSGPGLINLDFADVRAVMHDAGPALIGLGRGTGANRAIEAARQAIDSPLLEASIQGARGILFNVSGPADLQLREVREAADEIRADADPEANVIFGASFRRHAGEELLITLIATGLEWPTGSEAASRATKPKAVEPAINDAKPPVEPAEVISPVNGGRKRQPKVASTPALGELPRDVEVVGERSTPSAEIPAAAPSVAEVDLEVPSFLRRKGSG